MSNLALFVVLIIVLRVRNRNLKFWNMTSIHDDTSCQTLTFAKELACLLVTSCAGLVFPLVSFAYVCAHVLVLEAIFDEQEPGHGDAKLLRRTW